MRHILMITTALALAACSGPTLRLVTPTVASTLEIRASVGSLMLRSVSLPAYAAAEEVAFQAPDGLISNSEDVLWDDAPERAVTLQMTRHLTDILGVTVGPDPWPFATLPDVAIEVRVEEMLARADGVFSLRGQYFIGGDGIDYPNSAHSFDISQTIAGEGFSGLAAARAAAVLQLSEDIARKLGR